jgi:co-chaperonin GroES (HSP10)
VLHVGCGRYTKRHRWVPTTLRPGDRVLLPVSCDDMHAYDVGAGRECRILSETDVLGVIE